MPKCIFNQSETYGFQNSPGGMPPDPQGANKNSSTLCGLGNFFSQLRYPPAIYDYPADKTLCYIPGIALIFAPITDFLDVCNVKHPGQT